MRVYQYYFLLLFEPTFFSVHYNAIACMSGNQIGNIFTAQVFHTLFTLILVSFHVCEASDDVIADCYG